MWVTIIAPPALSVKTPKAHKLAEWPICPSASQSATAGRSHVSGRRTNLALLALTVLAVLSGFAAFSIGTPSGSWVVAAHGVLGLGILVLTPWKASIASRGFSRHGSSRWLSLTLALTVIITLASGLTLITGFLSRLGPFTMMQIHVGAGLTALAFTAVHYVQRPVSPRATDLNRRNTIRAASLLGAAGLAYIGGEWVLEVVDSPGADRRFTGSHEIEDDALPPATQWLNDRVQVIDRSSHVVIAPTGEYTVDEIERHDDTVRATLDCTGGWYATREWSGAQLDRLLGDISGESLVVRSVTGYWRRFPLEQSRQLLLATRLEGEPLRSGNGAPVRLVAPGRRGFWWVKWVDMVEVDDKPPWWQPPLPLA